MKEQYGKLVTQILTDCQLIFLDVTLNELLNVLKWHSTLSISGHL